MVELTFVESLLVLGYFFVPILFFGLFCFGGIILSNRMGGKNIFITLLVRLIAIGGATVALFYYFYWLVGVIGGSS